MSDKSIEIKRKLSEISEIEKSQKNLSEMMFDLNTSFKKTQAELEEIWADSEGSEISFETRVERADELEFYQSMSKELYNLEEELNEESGNYKRKLESEIEKLQEEERKNTKDKE